MMMIKLYKNHAMIRKAEKKFGMYKCMKVEPDLGTSWHVQLYES